MTILLVPDEIPDGEVVASADVNVDTAECTTSIFNYTKTE